MFVPRVVVVPAGGTVEFLNSDRLLHNLHSDSKGIPASTGRNREGGRFPSCSRTRKSSRWIATSTPGCGPG